MGAEVQLTAALALFREQGWDQADLSEAENLPLGSRSDQAAAARALRSADLDAVVASDIDPTMLGLFAIRLGVEPAIALELLIDAEQDVVAHCVAMQGKEYAERFIKKACYILDNDNPDLYGGSYFGYASVMLVVQDNDLGLEIPQDAAYLHDWVAVASDLYAPEWAPQFNYAAHILEPEELKATLREHIFSAAAMGLPIYGPLGYVLLAGIENRKLSRQTFIAWVLQQLVQDLPKAAVGRMAQLLHDELKITNKELKYNSVKMTEAIQLNGCRLMEIFGLRLLKVAPRSQVATIAVLLLSHPSHAYQAQVLEMLKTGRSVSNRQQQLLLPDLLDYQKTTKKQNADLVETLIRAWGTEPVPPPTDVDEADESANYWHATPGTWQPEPVELFQASYQALVKQAELLSGSALFSTLETEYFWYAFVRLSTGRLGTLARKLKGVDRRIRGGSIAQWVDSPLAFAVDLSVYTNVTAAREREILANLGKVPCLLSTPSFQDLSLSLDDFLSRLRAFEKQDLPVPLLDVYFALRRLDLKNIDAQVIEKRCGKYSITIEVADGPRLTRKCHVLLLDFQAIVGVAEPEGFIGSGPEEWENTVFSRFLSDCLNLDPSLYPLVGDADTSIMQWKETGLSRETHDYAQQIVRSRYQLSPSAATRLLLIQCETDHLVDKTVREALTQAWYRGLLNPSHFDLNVVDWSSTGIDLRAFTKVLLELVDDGMLALSWQIWDQLAAYAALHPKLLSEILPVVEALERFYPSARTAVINGVASHNALELPGLRALAAVRDSNNEVAVAHAASLVKLIDAELPKTERSVVEETQPAMTKEPATSFIDEYWFAQHWVQDYCGVPNHPDEAKVVCYSPKAIKNIGKSAPEKLVKKALKFDPRSLFSNDVRIALVLPNRPKSVYIIESGRWLATGEFPYHWQAIEKLTASLDNPPWLMNLGWLESRGWLVEAHASDIRVAKPEVLPDSIAAAMIAFLAAKREQDEVISLVKNYVERGLLGAAAVKSGMAAVFTNPDWRPQAAIRILTEHPQLLSALWPIITESIKIAGASVAAQQEMPRWANPLLLFTLEYGLVLSAATALGHIPVEDWVGIEQLASSGRKNRGIKRAIALKKMLTTYIDIL